MLNTMLKVVHVYVSGNVEVLVYGAFWLLAGDTAPMGSFSLVIVS